MPGAAVPGSLSNVPRIYGRKRMTTLVSPEPVPLHSPTAPPDQGADAARLRELGYEQELRRGLRIFDSVAMGFATISPVVGLYAVVLVGMVVAGTAWLWVLPLALAGQCLLLSVYSELASQFPISNGSYQWSRRLIGPRYGWFNGWVSLCAYRCRTRRSRTSARRGRSPCSTSRRRRAAS
jgi:hypothetical protein